MALSSAFVAGVVPGFEALGTKLADAFTTGIQAREARRARNQAALLETHRYAQDFGLKQAQLQFQKDQAEKQSLMEQRKFLAAQTAPVLDMAQGLKGAGSSSSTGGLGGGIGAPKLTPGSGQSLQDGYSSRNPLDVAQVGQRLARILQDPRIPEATRARANDLAQRASTAVDRRDEASYASLAKEADALDTLAYGGAGVGGAQPEAGPSPQAALVSRLIAAGVPRAEAEARAQDILGSAPVAPVAPSLPEVAPAAPGPAAPMSSTSSRATLSAQPQARAPSLPTPPLTDEDWLQQFGVQKGTDILGRPSMLRPPLTNEDRLHRYAQSQGLQASNVYTDQVRVQRDPQGWGVASADRYVNGGKPVQDPGEEFARLIHAGRTDLGMVPLKRDELVALANATDGEALDFLMEMYPTDEQRMIALEALRLMQERGQL